MADFDPRNHGWGLWRLNTNKPQIQQGSTGQAVGYLQGSLMWASGLGSCAALPGPWVFGQVTRQHLISFQTWWGLPATGVCNQATWNMIDAVNGWQGYP